MAAPAYTPPTADQLYQLVAPKIEKAVKVERPHFTGQQGKAKAIALASLKGDEETGDRKAEPKPHSAAVGRPKRRSI